MEDGPILFYDGECGLCHRFVLFVLRHETDPVFRFAPLQGKTFRERVDPAEAEDLPDSMVLLSGSDSLLTLSDAAVYALKTLPSGWRRLGILLGVFPKPLRDFGYRCVAAVRKKIFRKPDGMCPLVPEIWKKRFLP